MPEKSGFVAAKERFAMESWVNLVPLVLIVVVFWLFVIRPARRRQVATAAMQARLRVGAEVLLTSGIYGRIEAIDGESMQLAIAPGVTVRIHRQAVMSVVEPDGQAGLDDVEEHNPHGPQGPRGDH